jgi:hypothetical protein
MEFLVQTRLPLLVCSVQALDHGTGRPGAVVIGVMAVTQQELTAGGGMIPDSPASRLVAVVLPYHLINPGADRADNAELGDVGSEPGPETVIRSRLVHGAGMNCQPVIDRGCIQNPGRYDSSERSNRDGEQ